MKKYVKPSMNIIELQLKENIAALPTTVYRGSKNTRAMYEIALSQANSGLKAQDGDDWKVS